MVYCLSSQDLKTCESFNKNSAYENDKVLTKFTGVTRRGQKVRMHKICYWSMGSLHEHDAELTASKPVEALGIVLDRLY